jgi:phenylacetic acid degradation operon negative regulatory protein
MGYVPLYDGLWVSPNPLSAKATLALTDFAVQGMTIFSATQVDLGGIVARDPLQAWDLTSIGEQYATCIARWSPLLPRIRSRAVAGPEAVQARTEVMDSYRQFVVLDPRLPMGAMPQGWLREQAREIFVRVYDGLAGPALGHVRQTVERTVDVPPGGIDTHTVAELHNGSLLTPPVPSAVRV